VVYLVVLDCLLRATTKKRRQLFLRKKCTPDKILSIRLCDGLTRKDRRHNHWHVRVCVELQYIVATKCCILLYISTCLLYTRNRLFGAMDTGCIQGRTPPPLNSAKIGLYTGGQGGFAARPHQSFIVDSAGGLLFHTSNLHTPGKNRACAYGCNKTGQ